MCLRIARTTLIGAMLIGCTRLCGADAPVIDPRLLELAPNRWHKIHEQPQGDGLVFERQAHGASCFDAKRGRLILFGSNTHSLDRKNAPFFFDVAKRQWSQAYPEDAPATYRVTDEGIPVAGEKGNHPWATHTCGCVVLDSTRDKMVIVCSRSFGRDPSSKRSHPRPDRRRQISLQLVLTGQKSRKAIGFDGRQQPAVPYLSTHLNSIEARRACIICVRHTHGHTR